MNVELRKSVVESPWGSHHPCQDFDLSRIWPLSSYMWLSTWRVRRKKQRTMENRAKTFRRTDIIHIHLVSTFEQRAPALHVALQYIYVHLRQRVSVGARAWTTDEYASRDAIEERCPGNIFVGHVTPPYPSVWYYTSAIPCMHNLLTTTTMEECSMHSSAEYPTLKHTNALSVATLHRRDRRNRQNRGSGPRRR